MNSKYLFSFLILTFMTTACGVKSDPTYPAGTEIPAYVDEFTQTPQKIKKDKNKEKDKKKK